MRRYIAVSALLAVLLLIALPVAAKAGAFDLNWNTVDGGGATFSSGGGYQLGATIGQPDAGRLSGGVYTLNGGFWGGVGAPVAVVPVPGDVTGDNLVDGNDLKAVVRAFGASPSSPNWNPLVDLNGDGRVGILDLVFVALYFGQP